MTRRALPWLAALLLAAACTPTDEGPGEVPTFEVGAPATFVREVRAEGLLRAVEATPVIAPPDANEPMKIAWLAEDGVAVAAGDVVVRFDPTDMQRRLADSKDDVTLDERQIGKVSIESTATKNRRDRTAKLSVHEAAVARDLKVDDERILSRNEIAENTIDLELAEAKVAHARGVQAVERAVASNQVELHRIARDQHERSVAHAEQGLKRLEIAAPAAGVFVLGRDWRGGTIRVGDTTWPGQQIAELPVISRLEAEVFVLEADAGDLAAGLPADIVIDAQPDVVWKGSVGKVDTLAKPKHPEVPVHYFGVKLALAETDPQRMRVGQRVRATIRIERPDVIVVPRQAVFDEGGLSIVYRERAGGFDPVEVKLGAASAGRVVITSGLQPGDRIALRDPSRAASELLADTGDKGDKEPSPQKGP